MKQPHNKLLKHATTYTCVITLSLAPSTLLAQETEDTEQPTKTDRQFPRSFSKKQRHAPAPHLRPQEMQGGYRSIDGYGNNIAIPEWGSSEIPFLRLFPAAYEDGISSPAGSQRKSAREISNLIAAQTESVLNHKGASDMLWQWGQFLDHDITETPVHDPAEPFNIPVPTGDPSFDPDSTGTQEIPLSRSFYVDDDGFGVRQQVNLLTAYIDASNVYGSDIERAHALRTLDGTGRLKVTITETHGDLLPFNTEGIDNAGGTSDTLFIAGDIRANEQVGLTAMHTLFMREHNYRANEFQLENPDATGEEIYQHARQIVAAEMQAITYNEFLPLLLGPKALPKYKGYNPHVSADISNEFATAAYRFGHSLLSPTLLRLDAYGNEIAAGNLSLAAAFFRPTHTVEEGIEVTLRGLVTQQCQELDELVISEVRDFLFGAPGAGGLDLVALNIQRGRDHGLPDYNTARKLTHKFPAQEFSDITTNEETIARLEAAYTDINDMDLWIVGLAEDPSPYSDSMLGGLLHKIVAEQFTRLRDGDRYFYKHDLPQDLVEMVDQQTLATIIRRNTTIDTEIQDNVFLVTNPAEVDTTEEATEETNSTQNQRTTQPDKRRKPTRR
ncbi:MAG: peroxidase family protein [Akkermansiaceae bacterium]